MTYCVDCSAQITNQKINITNCNHIICDICITKIQKFIYQTRQTFKCRRCQQTLLTIFLIQKDIKKYLKSFQIKKVVKRLKGKIKYLKKKLLKLKKNKQKNQDQISKIENLIKSLQIPNPIQNPLQQQKDIPKQNIYSNDEIQEVPVNQQVFNNIRNLVESEIHNVIGRYLERKKQNKQINKQIKSKRPERCKKYPRNQAQPEFFLDIFGKKKSRITNQPEYGPDKSAMKYQKILLRRIKTSSLSQIALSCKRVIADQTLLDLASGIIKLMVLFMQSWSRLNISLWSAYMAALYDKLCLAIFKNFQLFFRFLINLNMNSFSIFLS